jgi:DNA-binding CsgD family transcriptional regulator
MPNGGSMRVSRPFAMGALEVLVTPLRTANSKISPALPGRASVMIVLVDPDQAIEMHASELRQLYGFTAAEARLALQLVMGKDLPAAALAMEVSIHTVRTLLKRAFERTGTHRQADFIAKMLSGPLGLFRIPHWPTYAPRPNQKNDTPPACRVVGSGRVRT